MYADEEWAINRENRRKLLEECAKSSNRKKESKTKREMMVIQRNIVNDVEKKQLIWFEHTKKVILEWIPPEIETREKTQKTLERLHKWI